MLHAKDLHGRAVIDVDQAKKLGAVDEVLLDPNGQRIAGLMVSHGTSFLDKSRSATIPASAVQAIGEDAITVRQTGEGDELGSDLGSLPRLSKVLGHRVVTQGGKLLGTLEDVLLEG